MNANQTKFLQVYQVELADEMRRKPDEFVWPSEVIHGNMGNTVVDPSRANVDVSKWAHIVATRMVTAMAKGTANIHGSNPIRRTCKKLDIGHTIGAIKEYLNHEG